VVAGQECIVLWDDIKDILPPELKILPIAAIPHKSKPFRSILDLSFNLHLKDGSTVPSTNDTSEKSGPHGSMDQIRHMPQCIIHAVAESNEDWEDLIRTPTTNHVIPCLPTPIRVK
jgi:hypothetical protein